MEKNKRCKVRNSRFHDWVCFVYCPGCGSKSLQPLEDKGWICTSCNFQYYFNMASVVEGIFELNDMIILTKRARDPQKGLWAFPGGFVEYGESLEEALAREIHEELNLKVDGFTYLCSDWDRYFYQGITYPLTVTFFIVKAKDVVMSTIVQFSYSCQTARFQCNLTFPSNGHIPMKK